MNALVLNKQTYKLVHTNYAQQNAVGNSGKGCGDRRQNWKRRTQKDERY